MLLSAPFLFYFHHDRPLIAAVLTNILLRGQPHVKAAREPEFEASASGAKFRDYFPSFQSPEYLTQVFKYAHALCSIQSLNFNVFFRVPQPNQIGTNPLPMVALQHDLIVFSRSSTSAKGLKFLCKPPEVRVFIVDALDYSHFSTPLPCIDRLFLFSCSPSSPN